MPSNGDRQEDSATSSTEDAMETEAPETNTPPSEDMFPVLGSDTFQKLTKIDMLPKWMAMCERVSNDISSNVVKIRHWEHVDRLGDDLRAKLKANHIKRWYPIQAAAIPLLLPPVTPTTAPPSDLCIAAPTGSGKTLVYCIPLVVLVRAAPAHVQAVVLLPTQTLADQVATVLGVYLPDDRTCMLLSSRNSLHSERERLWVKGSDGDFRCSGAHILVCTIRRLLEHMYYVEPETYFSLDDSSSTLNDVRPSSLDLSHLAVMVVDEADRLMHDTRFDWAGQIQRARGDGHIRKILLSATLSHDTQLLSQFRLHSPMLIRASGDVTTGDVSVALPSTLTQQYLVCEASMKPLSLFALLKRKAEWTTVLVFVQSREDANRLGPLLTAMVAADSKSTAYRVEAIHADLFSKHRAKIVRRFVAGTTRVLIATDMVARGWDVVGVHAVINYNLCALAVNYTHRAGRTARQGADGTVVSLIAKDETLAWTAFLRTNGWSADVTKIDVGLTPVLVELYKEALSGVRKTQNTKRAARDMRGKYTFDNLLGTVYAQGNLAFIDRDTLLSPVGNKVSVHSLASHRARTLPVEASLSLTRVAVSPNGANALLVTGTGEALYVCLATGALLHRHKFGKAVQAVEFSPDGRHIAVARDTDVHIYASPGVFAHVYNAFLLEHIYHLCNETVTTVGWSGDSRLVLAGGGDSITRCMGGDAKYVNVRVQTLGAHTAPIVGAFFADQLSYNALTVDRRGALVQWTANIDGEQLREGRFSKKMLKESSDIALLNFTKTHRTQLFASLSSGAHELTSVDYNRSTQLLASGSAEGALLLHSVSDGQAALLHSISVGTQSICSLAVNSSGEWLAVATKGEDTTSMLLVWEWQSETYVMRSQSHAVSPSCIAYSPDGQHLASGSSDAKVKVWCVRSGHCLVTFPEHTAEVTGVQWTQGGKAVVSASADGTVRAFDIKRYVNFRTLVCDRAAQLSCLAVDASGEVVCAGARDMYDVFVWSLSTGRLLDVLAGHSAPVSACTFNATAAMLATTSWDKSLRLWHIYDKQATETVTLMADGIDCTFSPSSREVAVLTLDSNVTVFDWETGGQVRSIEAARHLHAGRGRRDVVTAVTSGKAKSWRTVAYSPEGDHLLVGGESARVCVFSAKHGLLLHTVTITVNRSLDATTSQLDWRRLRQLGEAAMVDSSDDDNDKVVAERKRKVLPGVASGDRSARSTRPTVVVSEVVFSPTGQSWACATTEGLLVYAQHAQTLFQPTRLTRDMTPASITRALSLGDYATAMSHCLALNDKRMIQVVVEAIPQEHGSVPVLSQSMSGTMAMALLDFLSMAVDTTASLHLYTVWIHQLLQRHGGDLKSAASESLSTYTAIQHSLTSRHSALARICDENKYMIDYVLDAPNAPP